MDGASNYGWGREQDLRYTSIMSYGHFFQISTLDFSLSLSFFVGLLEMTILEKTKKVKFMYVQNNVYIICARYCMQEIV